MTWRCLACGEAIHDLAALVAHCHDQVVRATGVA